MLVIMYIISLLYAWNSSKIKCLLLVTGLSTLFQQLVVGYCKNINTHGENMQETKLI